MSTTTTNSEVETAAAPEWLLKLEKKREKLSRGKLLHDLGAGAPCMDCGDKCPGLDLHFWRKVCRNCKCRKETHCCTDDEFSGWAQYEVLGQIRSKPAFINIKKLANQPVKLEWIPPNTSPDIVSDYMQKLGNEAIPIVGSEAAKKRKQKLEFQMPLHDLDATLCHNLSESEANQLQQYVNRIRENCVGQGNVVRVGNCGMTLVGHVEKAAMEYAKAMAAINEPPLIDPILTEILSAHKLTSAIVQSTPNVMLKPLVVFANKPPSMATNTEFAHDEPQLTNATKSKLCGLNRRTLASLIHNGPIYDKILGVLKEKNFDISSDPTLNIIENVRKEYNKNLAFKNEIDSIVDDLEATNKRADYTTPIKAKNSNLIFNSPLPPAQPPLPRQAAQMQQETPMRRVKFGQIAFILHECGLPANVAYEQDAVFNQLLNSRALKMALEQQAHNNMQQPQQSTTPLVIASTLPPLPNDFAATAELSQPIKARLQELSVNAQTLQSVLLNAPFYERLFDVLKNKQIDFDNCAILKPIQRLRHELLNNKPLLQEVRDWVRQSPSSYDICYSGSPTAAMALSGSRSNDSGFDSVPTTPSGGGGSTTAAAAASMQATPGKFVILPAIEDMNMYGNCRPQQAGGGAAGDMQMLRDFQNFDLAEPQQQQQQQQPISPTLKCKDCNELINFGECAVKAERAGRDIAWHPECFKCHSCRELLADLVYFFHGGHVYCGRDLAIKLKIPRCKACDELIFTKEYTAAEDATFHIKHFCCYHCDEPLAGRQYIPDEKSNMPLCLKCYDEYFAASCQLCKQTIAAQGIAWNDLHWHADCFVCAGRDCHKSLIGGRFCVKDNLPFCSPACVRSVNLMK